WAVRQLFPTMPIHRLDRAPSRRGVLADLTCDSDGKMYQFIDLRDVKHFLELHQPNGEPYLIASFLIGAYQEILGDLHNLFGDTDAVHVRLDDSAGPLLQSPLTAAARVPASRAGRRGMTHAVFTLHGECRASARDRIGSRRRSVCAQAAGGLPSLHPRRRADR